MFSVSFSRSKLHSGPSDRLTPSSMNLKEMNPPQRFIRLCSTPVKTRDTKSCGTALEGTSESFCHAVKCWALCYVLVVQTALSVFVCACFCGGMQPFSGSWKKKDFSFYPRVLAPLYCESFTNVTMAALRLSSCSLFTPSGGDIV